MSADPFRIAIAGFGWWGQHIVSRLRGHAWIQVAAVIDPDPRRQDEIRAAGCTALPSIEAALALPDVDAIILTTPNTLHEAQVCQVAAAGRHVFCEKPLGLTGESARRSVAACEAAGVTLGIGHERRYEPALQALKSAIDAGELGTIMHAEAAFSHDKLIHVPTGDWRTLKATAPAAAMTGMGIHLTDLFISFFGEVETVQAMVGHRSLNWETGDVVTVQLGFRDGPTASLSAILHTPHFIRTHVFGSAAWIEVLNDSHPDTPGGIVRMRTVKASADPIDTRVEWSDAVVANLEAFGAACQGRATYPFTHRQMVHNIEVLEAIARSAETREAVHL